MLFVFAFLLRHVTLTCWNAEKQYMTLKSMAFPVVNFGGIKPIPFHDFKWFQGKYLTGKIWRVSTRLVLCSAEALHLVCVGLHFIGAKAEKKHIVKQKMKFNFHADMQPKTGSQALHRPRCVWGKYFSRATSLFCNESSVASMWPSPSVQQ